jgi:hypothetical protein
MISIYALLLTAAVAGIGAYFGAYLKQKGKNLATHEDIDKLVEQVAAVTKTAKEIETKISGDLWDRQKRWELKRDVLLETAKRLAAAEDALANLNNVYMTALKNTPESAVFLPMKVEGNEKWFKALAALEESEFFAGVTCGKNIEDAIDEFRRLGITVGAKISKDDCQSFTDSYPQLLALKNGVREAIRKELGIDNLRP